MNLFKSLTATAIGAIALISSFNASAHIVGIGWTFEANGDLTFDALHWHGAQTTPRGALIVDGTSYNFTSFTNNTTSMTGLDGALVNSSYSTYDGAGTLSAIGTPRYDAHVDDWLHVTISGLSAGAHTLSAAYGPGGLTSWTLNGGVTTVGIVTPPVSVPEPSIVALMGLGLVGMGLATRRKQKKA